MLNIEEFFFRILILLERSGLRPESTPSGARINRFVNTVLVLIPVTCAPFIIYYLFSLFFMDSNKTDSVVFSSGLLPLAIWYFLFAVLAMVSFLLVRIEQQKSGQFLFCVMAFAHCLYMGAHLSDRLSVGLMLASAILISYFFLQIFEKLSPFLLTAFTLASVILINNSYFLNFIRIGNLDTEAEWITTILNYSTVFFVDVLGFTLLMQQTETEATLNEKKSAEKLSISHKIFKLHHEFQLAQETGKIGSWEWNPKSQQVLCSPECARLLGILSGPENTDKRLTSSFPSHISLALALTQVERSDRIGLMLQLKQAEKRALKIHTRFRVTFDGRTKYIEIIGKSNCDMRNKARVFFGVLRDITIEKEAERAQMERENLQSMNEKLSALGKLAGEVAHEVNNPLAIVMGRIQQLQRLKEEKKEVSEEYLEKFFNSLLSSVDRIHRTSQTLLSFSTSLDSGRVSLAQLANLFDSVELKISKLLQERNVVLERKGNLTLEVQCQPAQIVLLIEQILRTILNAMPSNPAESQTLSVEFGQLRTETTLSFQYPAKISKNISQILNKEESIFLASAESRFSAYLLSAVLQIHRGSLYTSEGHMFGLLTLSLPHQAANFLSQNLSTPGRVDRAS